MEERFRIAIIGAGPGGLSAAARAADLGVSHVLIEASPRIADTVHRYQKAKPVMAEPAWLPLRSTLPFAAGTREAVLESWLEETARRSVALRLGARVTAISGGLGDFRIELASGERLAAETVVLAIGLQGDIRRLGVPGEALPGVQYQLDDPWAYEGETILVVGGGDSAIENALALAPRNRVLLIHRQDEFARCGEANLGRLKQAQAAGAVEVRLGTPVSRIEAGPEGGLPLVLVAQSPQGEERIPCHRVIARLGTEPPRRMLERFHIAFSSGDPTAAPRLTDRYESSVPGLHVIGALAGYPLIKQALNQGYEVVEHILGRPIRPADEPFLREKFRRLPGGPPVAEGLERLAAQPHFASLTTPQLRELMSCSEVLAPAEGEVVFHQNDYSNSFFSVLRGTTRIHVEKPDGRMATFDLPAGSFFGEIGLLSGRRRSGTAVAGRDCVLIETPRRIMLRLLAAAPEMQRSLDEAALTRIVRNCYGPSLADADILHLVRDATLKRCRTGETVFAEGDPADAVYLIRRGSVTISRRVNGKDVILAYVSAGNYVGEMALVSRIPRTATVRAAAPAELVALDAGRFMALVDEDAIMRGEVAGRYLERMRSNEAMGSARNGELIHFLMEQGVGEATDVLLIDYSRCIRCDNCETACADVHGGTSRLRRVGGRTYAHIHVPASCRHCENPRCMQNCPADAIRRSTQGETFISESCIGCGNCRSGCPHGVIQLAPLDERHRPPGLLQILLGRDRRATAPPGGDAEPAKAAVKCDMCRGIIGGAACVRACPTGAAFRVSPEQFVSMSGQSANWFA